MEHRVKLGKKSVLVALSLVAVLIIGAYIFVVISFNNNSTALLSELSSGFERAKEPDYLIKNVWYNAIYHISDPETDKYTKIDGKFVQDFNNALDALYADEEFLASIDELIASREEATRLMNSLKNPPPNCKDDYAVIKKYYICYMDYTSLLINLSDSYNSYHEEYETISDRLEKVVDDINRMT